MIWLLAALFIYPAIVWYEASKEEALSRKNIPGLTNIHADWEGKRNAKLKVYFIAVGVILFVIFGLFTGSSPSDRYL